SFLFLPNFYARLAGHLAGVPAIVSSLRGKGIEGRLRYRIDVATCSLCDVVIANSAAGRDDYVRRGASPDKVVVIRNGLDPARLTAGADPAGRRRWGLDRFEHVVGMVASLQGLKAQRLLVSAMQEVVRRHPRPGLVLVG